MKGKFTLEPNGLSFRKKIQILVFGCFNYSHKALNTCSKAVNKLNAKVHYYRAILSYF